eukprot:COSAG05_NODE_429_length_9889_cov_11.904290_3_plen_127_part_00
MFISKWPINSPRIIPGVGPTLCNCHATIDSSVGVANNAAYQLYENDSPQTYSMINCYFSKRRVTSTKPRNVRDPDAATAATLKPSHDDDEEAEEEVAVVVVEDDDADDEEEEAWQLIEAEARPPSI